MNGNVIHAGQVVSFRALGTTYRVLSAPLDGSCAIVEHTLEPRSLGAPMHKHTYEDEISYVLEGELSAIQDGKIEIARPGQFIVKPRGIFHTFWNSTDQRIRWIEVITPGNFSHYFAELAPFLNSNPPQMESVRATAVKYGLIIDPTAAQEIIDKYGLKPLG